jgi:hypothetical protein
MSGFREEFDTLLTVVGVLHLSQGCYSRWAQRGAARRTGIGAKNAPVKGLRQSRAAVMGVTAEGGQQENGARRNCVAGR